MDKDQFIAISSKASEDEQIKLRVLWDAVLQNLKSYKNKYSQQNLKSWQSAEKALDDFAAKIESKEKTDAAKAGETLPNVLAVVGYLDELGYKATTSTIYRHRDVGKISPEPDGLFNTITVEQYAAAFLKKKNRPNNLSATAAASIADKEVSLARKLAASAELTELKTSILKGEYVLRETIERDLAQKAVTLKSGFESFARTICGELNSILLGDATRIPDAIERLLSGAEKFFATYSEDREFQVSTEAVNKWLEKKT